MASYAEDFSIFNLSNEDLFGQNYSTVACRNTGIPASIPINRNYIWVWAFNVKQSDGTRLLNEFHPKNHVSN